MTGPELKQLRLLLGWSQARLAQELAVHVQTVSNWERGVWAVPPLVEKYLELKAL